ncbi:hypothetical protein BH23ACT9_BH23ACT9_31030 [soil metagenome]
MTSPVEDFEQRVVRARQRLEQIQQGGANPTEELLLELQFAVEELQTAVGELHVQQEQLVDAQRALETERRRYQVLCDADRELQIVDLVARLTAGLANDFDLFDTLTSMCEQLAGAIGIDACGILLADGECAEVAAVSGEDAKQVELIQIQRDDGPCIDALQRNQVTVVNDLHAVADRWPDFVKVCAVVGLSSVASFPLPGPEGPMGSLNTFRRNGGFTREDIATCEAVARVVVTAITNARIFEDSRRQAEHLRHALESRVVIEQAKGIVSRDQRLRMPQAFDLLRTTARRRRVKLHTLAGDIVGGWVDPADLG